MLSVRELFYGLSEPVWISKDLNKDDNKNGDERNAFTSYNKGLEKMEYPVYTSVPYHPFYNYNQQYVPYRGKKDDARDDDEKDRNEGRNESNGTNKKKEIKLEMKIPICCSECEDSVSSTLYALKGVKSVMCNTNTRKVTVVTTAAAADILIECRKLFKKSRMWSDDD
jgi:hypothetical protein